MIFSKREKPILVCRAQENHGNYFFFNSGILNKKKNVEVTEQNMEKRCDRDKWKRFYFLWFTRVIYWHILEYCISVMGVHLGYKLRHIEKNQHIYVVKWDRFVGEIFHELSQCSSRESLQLSLVLSLAKGIALDKSALVLLLMTWEIV